MLGEKGEIEESEKLNDQVDQLRQTKDDLLMVAINQNLASKQMKICDVCGAKQSINDLEKRNLSHLEGKLHQGFQLIRNEYESLKKRGEMVEINIEVRKEEMKRAGKSAEKEISDFYNNYDSKFPRAAVPAKADVEGSKEDKSHKSAEHEGDTRKGEKDERGNRDERGGSGYRGNRDNRDFDRNRRDFNQGHQWPRLDRDNEHSNRMNPDRSFRGNDFERSDRPHDFRRDNQADQHYRRPDANEGRSRYDRNERPVRPEFNDSHPRFNREDRPPRSFENRSDVPNEHPDVMSNNPHRSEFHPQRNRDFPPRDRQMVPSHSEKPGLSVDPHQRQREISREEQIERMASKMPPRESERNPRESERNPRERHRRHLSSSESDKVSPNHRPSRRNEDDDRRQRGKFEDYSRNRDSEGHASRNGHYKRG